MRITTKKAKISIFLIKNVMLSISGSFFMLNQVINDCQGGKIKDVAI